MTFQISSKWGKQYIHAFLNLKFPFVSIPVSPEIMKLAKSKHGHLECSFTYVSVYDQAGSESQPNHLLFLKRSVILI